MVVPLALAAASRLGHDDPWGYLVAGFVLAKAAATGLALVSMTWFAAQAGQTVDRGLSAVWVLLAVSAIGMWGWMHALAAGSLRLGS